jgi:hypothetical protein
MEINTLNDLIDVLKSNSDYIIEYIISEGKKIEYNKPLKRIKNFRNIDISFIKFNYNRILNCSFEIYFKDSLVHHDTEPAYKCVDTIGNIIERFYKNGLLINYKSNF